MIVVNILENIEYGSDKPVVNVLFDTESTKEVRISFKEGQEMKKHKTKYPIVVEIVEGTIDFGVKNQRYNLHKGTLVALEGNIEHDLIAKKDSIVRLSLNKLDQTQRVRNLVE